MANAVDWSGFTPLDAAPAAPAQPAPAAVNWGDFEPVQEPPSGGGMMERSLQFVRERAQKTRNDIAAVERHLGGLWDVNAGSVVEGAGGITRFAGESPQAAAEIGTTALAPDAYSADAMQQGRAGRDAAILRQYGVYAAQTGRPAPTRVIGEQRQGATAPEVLAEVASNAKLPPNEVTQLGIDIADIGKYQREQGAAASHVDAPESVLSDPIQALKYFGNAAAGSAVPMGIAMAAPGPGLSMFGAQAFGSEYAQRREEGRPIGEAFQSGVIHGAAEVIPERISLGVLRGELGQALTRAFGDRVAKSITDNIASRVVAGGVAEGASEVLTQAVQDLNDKYVMGDDISRDQLLRNLRDAFFTGAVMGAPLAGAHATLEKGSDLLNGGTVAAPVNPAATPPASPQVDIAPPDPAAMAATAAAQAPAQPADLAEPAALNRAVASQVDAALPEDPNDASTVPAGGVAPAEVVPAVAGQPGDGAAAPAAGAAPEQGAAADVAGAAAPAPASGAADAAPARPRFDPDTRARAAADAKMQDLQNRLGLTPEQAAAVRAEFDAPAERDRVTGLYRSEELDRTLRAALDASEPGVYVEADLTNLGGLNAKLGTSGADPALKEFADTIREELEKVADTVGIRKGGDEMGFVTTGASKAKVDAAMARARERFLASMAAQGHADVAHTKEGKEPGVGLHFGTSAFKAGMEIGDIVRAADTLVEKRKKGASYGNLGKAQTARPAGDAGSGTAAGAGPSGIGNAAAPAAATPGVAASEPGQGEGAGQAPAGAGSAAPVAPAADRYSEAVAAVRSAGRPTVSTIQSALGGIRYNDAAALLDRMQQEGVVTAKDSRGKRTLVQAEAPAAPAAEPTQKPAGKVGAKLLKPKAIPLTGDNYRDAVRATRQWGEVSGQRLSELLKVDPADVRALMDRMTAEGVISEEDRFGRRTVVPEKAAAKPAQKPQERAPAEKGQAPAEPAKRDETPAPAAEQADDDRPDPPIQIRYGNRAKREADARAAEPARQRRAAASGGTDRAAVQSTVDALSRTWRNAPPITVYETPADAPGKLDSDAAGAYVRGKVMLFASNLQNAEHAQFVLLHETLGHHGLLGTLGPKLRPTMRTIYATNRSVRERAQAWMRENQSRDEELATEEALADMTAADLPKLSGWKRLVAAVRDALRRAGFNLDMSDTDIAALLTRAADYVRNGTTQFGAAEGAKYHKAWHGSPHEFDEFKTSAIGTGEGAQVYGHGLYFAGNRAVAENYRKGLSYKDVVREFRRDAPDDADFDEVMDAVDRGDFKPKMAEVLRALQADDWLGFDYPAQAITAAFRNLENNDPSQRLRDAVKNYGALYEVELAPKETDYLDWDAPISKQPKQVRDAIDDNLRPDLPADLLADFEKGDITGGEFYNRFANAVDETMGYPDREEGTNPSKEVASSILAEAGIPGIRYFDKFSRANGDGTRNYVIFDDSNVKTVAKYSKAKKGDGNAEVRANESTATEAGRLRQSGGIRGSAEPVAMDRGAKQGGEGSRGPLEGLPRRVKVDGVIREFGPFEPAREAARKYAESAGIEYNPPSTYATVDPVRATRIAGEFDAMTHDPSDPQVKASYDSMIAETLAQYRAMLDTGLQVEFITGDDPYGNPRNAIIDVVENNHLWVFPTVDGFGGSASADVDISGNPLLAPTEFKISGKTALANDIFRAVHDYFGHVKEGVGFRADGEENAWRMHSAMYSPLARRAMTTETRGQNSWVNFGPHAEFNRTADGGETQYAPQKIGLLPEWVSQEGMSDPAESDAPKYAKKKKPLGGSASQYTPATANTPATGGAAAQRYTPPQQSAAPGGPGSPSKQQSAAAKAIGTTQMNPGAFDGYTLPTESFIRAYRETQGNAFRKFVAGMRAGGRWLRRNFVDDLHPLLTIENTIKQLGTYAGDMMNAYQRAELFHGRAGQRIRNFRRDYMQPLGEDIAKSKVTLDELSDFLYAQFAPRRNQIIDDLHKGKPSGAKFAGQGSGWTDAKAAQVLADFRKAGKYDELERFANRIYAMNAERINVLESAGLISKETADEWRQEPHYVPLKDFADGREIAFPQKGGQGKGFSQGSRVTQMAKGRTSEADNLVENTIAQVEMAYVRAEKNAVAQSLLSLVIANPNSSLWEVARIKTKPIRDPMTGEVLEDMYGNKVFTFETPSDRSPEIFNVKVDGKTYAIKFKGASGEALATALKNLGATQLGPLMSRLRTISRYVSLLRTSWNPEFVISNFARDVQTAFSNMSVEESGKFARRMVKLIKPSVSAAFRGETGMKSHPVLGKYYEEFLLDGGRTDFSNIRTTEEIAKDLSGIIRNTQRSKLNPIKVARKTWDYFEAANTAVENASRLAAYVTARENGMARKDAASLAKNLTVNFNRHGVSGPQMNALWNFANASIQSNARYAQFLVKNPKVALKRNLLPLFGLGFALSMLNGFTGGDDDDGEDRWAKVPDYERDRNLILMFGPHKIKLPMPYTYNLPFVIGSRIADVATGRAKAKSVIGDVARAVLNSANPLGEAPTAAGYIAPTLADPFVEIDTNQNFFGGPIRPENSFDKVPDPDSQKAFESTPDPWRWIAEGLNAATGGSAVRPGMIDVSPTTFNHLFNFALGGVGAFLGRSWNSTAGAAIKGELPEPNQVPFLRSVYGRAGDSQVRTDFYSFSKDAGYRIEEAELADKEGRSADASDDQHKEWAAALDELAPALKEAESDLRKLRKERKAAKAAGDEAAAKAVDKEIRDVQAEFNKVYVSTLRGLDEPIR